ncbi:MAG: hypothetical protein R3D02_08700 [Hyphomicrobiales bacterium]
MADYYAVLKRALSGLPNNTGEARRAVYDKARNALVNQLKAIEPPLKPSEITRQRLDLEEAIRRVESEAANAALFARRPAAAQPAAGAAPEVAVRERPAEPAPQPKVEPQPKPEPPAPRKPAAPEERVEPRMEPRPDTPAAPVAPAPDADIFEDKPPVWPTGENREAAREPARGFEADALHKAVRDAENLGGASREAVRGARETLASVDEEAAVETRLEPRMERPSLPGDEPIKPRGQRPPAPAEKPGAEKSALDKPKFDPSIADEAEDEVAEEFDDAPIERLPDSGGGTMKFLLLILVVLIIGVGVIGWWQKDALLGLPPENGAVEQAGTEAPAPAPSSSGKIEDRLPQDGVPASETPVRDVGSGTTPTPAPAPGGDNMSAAPEAAPAAGGDMPTALVSQRSILYEETAPEDPAKGVALAGGVTWELGRDDQSSAPVIRARVEIPDRGLKVILTIRRNDDTALPASHLVEMLFDFPGDFPARASRPCRASF